MPHPVSITIVRDAGQPFRVATANVLPVPRFSADKPRDLVQKLLTEFGANGDQYRYARDRSRRVVARQGEQMLLDFRLPRFTAAARREVTFAGPQAAPV